MGDDDDRPANRESFQRVLDQSFALSVQGRSGLIQNQNGRILQDGSRDGDALFLTPGESYTAE